MTDAQVALVTGIHRLVSADRDASTRVARLLVTGELEARAVIGMLGGAPLTPRALHGDLGFSAGGAVALMRSLESRRLARPEPDPDDPAAGRLRLTAGAEAELHAALHGLPAELARISARLTPVERRAVADCLGLAPQG